MIEIKENFKHDLKSSVVIFLIALPLCIGIAIASGTPVISGIIAGVVGGIVTGILSRSQVSVDGPAAGMVAIVALVLSYLGGFPAFLTALFFAGLIQVLFGLLRLGQIGDYIPNSVIRGLLSGIGIIFILKQIPHFLGHDSEFLVERSIDWGSFEFLRSFHLGSIAIGLSSLLVLLLAESKNKKCSTFFSLLPAAVWTVVLGIILNYLFKIFAPSLFLDTSHVVRLNYEHGRGGLTAPDWTQVFNSKMYLAALFLALMTSIESLINVEASDRMDTFKRYTSKNRELVAQGIGNSFSGLLGGIPITSVIVRTSLNIRSGAKTKLSTILHGCWLLIAVVFFSSVIELIPIASISAILLVLGWKMASLPSFLKMKNKGNHQFVPFMITVLGIVFFNILWGVLLGILVSFIFMMKSKSIKAMVLVNDGKSYLLRFYKDVSFLNKPILTRLLKSVPPHSKLLIDGGQGTYIDTDIIDLLEDFLETAKHKNIDVEIRKSSLAINPFFKG